MAKYYWVCFLVLSSHLMGMSRWLSAEDTYSAPVAAVAEAERLAADEQSAGSAGRGSILRKFQYTYWCGLMAVTTYHVRAEDPSKFRLIEYIDFNAYLVFVINAVFWLGLPAAAGMLPTSIL